ncbi:hypothetical protein QQY79_04125 [Flavobacterium tructae]|uniref:hypothetical protein n=1 Tax=Flavobacterium tructae TaxID=1114873 RepID=UPI002551D395|nr:hypothetical protein [Flavobacterium tructae]MDL2141696.1 hypothetical protein [Flavobacterium tructae]
MFQKGDILEAANRELTKGRHFIIYYEGFSQDDFIGGMITHSEINGNLKMDINHFEILDENGEEYKVIYDDSYIVNAKLIKPHVWGPYTKVGSLSVSGITFFENNIAELEPQTFANYYRGQRNN